jgi:hypothetical protein
MVGIDKIYLLYFYKGANMPDDDFFAKFLAFLFVLMLMAALARGCG